MAFNLSGTVQTDLITDLFIPEVRKSLVAGAFLTTKEEVNAESIKIWGVGAVTVGDYTGGDVAGNDHVDSSVLLTLDDAKYFKENVERIDSEEAALNILPGIIEAGAYGIADQIDQACFTELSATTNVAVGTFTALDATTVKSMVSAMGTKLTRSGAPKTGRKLAITPEVSALLAEAGIATGSNEIATEAGREGFVTRFGGFDIYETVNLADATTGSWAIASVPRGGALGLGYNELDVEPVSGQFYDTAKGLTAFGVKLVKNEYVVKADIDVA